MHPFGILLWKPIDLEPRSLPELEYSFPHAVLQPVFKQWLFIDQRSFLCPLILFHLSFIMALLWCFPVSPLLTCICADSRIKVFCFLRWTVGDSANEKKQDKREFNTNNTPFTVSNLLAVSRKVFFAGPGTSPIKFIPCLHDLLSVRTLVNFFT